MVGDLLGFELLTGSTADFAPGSPDLPKVVGALERLVRTPCPKLPLKEVAQRWAPYTDPAALPLLHGDHLLHTDMAPHNVIVDDHAAHLIDWAWPTRGPAWVAPAVRVLRLLEAGTHPSRPIPGPRSSPPGAPPHRDAVVAAFAAANAALWAELATQDPARGWKAGLAVQAARWADYVHRTRPSIPPRPS